MGQFNYPQNIPDNVRFRLPAGPIREQSEDELEHVEHARELKRLIQEVVHHSDRRVLNGITADGDERKNVIALLGEFGTGKSSIFYLLQHELQTDDSGSTPFQLVRLSAWKHDAGDLRVALLRKIHWLFECNKRRITEEAVEPQVIQEINSDFDRLFYTTSARQSVDSQLPNSVEAIRHVANQTLMLEAGLPALGALFFGVGAYFFLLAFSLPDAVTGGLCSAALLGGGYLLSHLVKRYGETVRDYAAPSKLTQSKEAPRTSEQLEAAFAHFVRKWSTELSCRPVFFVDDVDRQRASRLVEVLDAVRTFMEVGDCVFVIACDEQRVKEAVAETRKAKLDDDEHGPTAYDDYVQRYFPTVHRLPPFEAKDMVSFAERAVRQDENHHLLAYLADNHGFPLRAVIEILVHDGVRRPRQAIRLVDEFTAKLGTAARLESTRRLNPGTVTGYPEFLARVVVLFLDFPFAIADLQDEPELLSWIGLREREGQGVLESHQIKATDRWYKESTNGDPTEPRSAALIRFVARHARHAAPSARPFIYLNEFGHQGIFSDATRQAVGQMLAAGQAERLREKLVAGDGQRELVSDVIFEYFAHEEQDLSGMQNAVEILPELFDEIEPRRHGSVADEWASRVRKLDVEERLVKFDVRKLLSVMRCVQSQTLLRDMLPKAFGLTEEEGAETTGPRVVQKRVLAGLGEIALLERAEAGDAVRKFLGGGNANAEEGELLLELCSFLSSVEESDRRVCELFGRGFGRRLNVWLTAQPDDELPEEDEADAPPRVLPDANQVVGTYKRLWSVFGHQDRVVTIKELVADQNWVPVAVDVLREQWKAEDGACLEELVYLLLGACSAALDAEVLEDAAQLVAEIVSSQEDVRSERLLGRCDTLGVELVKSKISWGVCIEVFDRIASNAPEADLKGTHLETAGKIAVYGAANEVPEDGIKNIVMPYFVKNTHRFSEEDVTSVVDGILSSLVSAEPTEMSEEAKSWVESVKGVDRIGVVLAKRIGVQCSALGQKAAWKQQERRAELAVKWQGEVDAASVEKGCKQLSSYVVQQAGHPDWVNGALRTLERLMDGTTVEARQETAKALIQNWGSLQVNEKVRAAAVLKRCLDAIAQEGIDATYRSLLHDLIKEQPLAAWPVSAHEWPYWDLNEQLELLGVLSEHADNSELVTKPLEAVLNEDEVGKASALAKQLARKYPAALSAWLTLMGSVLDGKRKREEASEIVKGLSTSWDVETDVGLLRAATQWLEHPQAEVDALLRKLVVGAEKEKLAVAGILKEYLPKTESQRDRSFVDSVTRALAEAMEPLADPSVLRALANGLKDAGLTHHDAVYDARDRLKKLRDGGPDEKELWNEISRLLPRRPILSSLLGGSDASHGS